MKKPSIERKILIPFLFVVIIPSLIIGMTSMWSSYQSEKQQKIQNIKDTMISTEQYIGYLTNQVKTNDLTEVEAKKLAKAYLDTNSNFYLKDDTGRVFHQGELIEEDSYDWLREKVSGIWKRELGEESWVFIRQLYDWNWTIYYPIDFSILSQTLINIQKYTLLIIMISGIIAIELTIIFSHHLSKPIKNLANYCENIRQGTNKMTTGVSSARKDEIGILSNSIKSMVASLDERNEQLVKMKQINETILNHTHVGMVLVTSKGKKWIANFAAKQMIAKIPVLEEKIKEFINEEKFASERVTEIWSFNINDEKVFYSINSIAIGEDKETKSWLITFENITERKKLENRMERVERLASLGKMASGLAHEIRNPLAGIKTTTELLKRRLVLEGENQYLVENMLVEVDRVNQIIGNLLQLSRPIDSNPKVISLDDAILSTISLLKSIAMEYNVKLHYEQTNLELWIDLNHFRQILINLILNAIQAMPNGGKVKISVYEKLNDIIIEVNDNGVGIEEDILDKIFNPFYTTRSEGTGLGLAIVHQLVTQNNGEIDVKTSKGKGTTFVLNFPGYKEVG